MLDACIQKFIRTGHRVLVFNQMTKVVDLQEQLLHYRGIPYFRLDGSTTPELRKRMVEEFNDEASATNVFLLTTRAGGLGVNLQTADTVIIFDSDWNPQADLQAQDRAHRIGQKREVRILRFITAKSVEEEVMERATFKRGLEDKIIKAGMFDETSKDSDRQEMLRRLLQEDEANQSDDDNELPTEEEINRTLSRSDDEFEVFNKIDQERSKEIQSLPRLLSEAELPRWLTNPKPDEIHGKKDAEELLMPVATKKRSKRSGRYTVDNLSDDQYLNLIEREAAGKSFEEAEASVRRKRRKMMVPASRQRHLAHR